MFKKLKTEMYANDVDQKILCKAIGRSESYMTQRMTGRKPFNLNDVYCICRCLHIPCEKIHEYFPLNGKEDKRDKLNTH